ncbi:pseudouridylate synthase TRUB2, mitochondrial-like [Tubulanus polymorphus]|uniref:pseudouridylate synthase TRUB2, mitochondrial-like n=1 Tax=Tubulanus polymorphus TaxID=672921 RepID=UPI003DA2089F
MMNKWNYAPAAFEALNGVFCVYKPADVPMARIVNMIKEKLADGLNSMPGRPLRTMVQLNENKTDTDGLPVVTTVPDLADHPLVVGPRYLPEDFRITYSNKLSKPSSGVVALGIGRNGSYKASQMKYAGYMRVYHVNGILGRCTHDFQPTGRLIERTTWRHVTSAKINRCISAAQAGHQRNMYRYMGVEMDSQEAYEVAARGLVRPQETVNEGPIIYGMKLVEYKPPEFTLEVHCIGEYCTYLRKFVHELSLDMKSSAVCSLVRRIRYGHFTLDHALLRKHWTVPAILGSIEHCKPLVRKDKLKPGLLMKPLEKTEKLLLPDGDFDRVEEAQEYLPTGT